MAWGRRGRHYCVNVAGCRYAREDFPYDDAILQRGGGRCIGIDGDGCGAELAHDAVDLRFRWLLIGVGVVALLAVAAKPMQHTLFPEPITNIGFASQESRLNDAAALLPIAVRREAGLDQRVVIQYQSTDGTAKAGEDYEAVKGALTFEPGESSKTVSVTILPDLRQSKGERYFSLLLDNVAGSPKHVVFIQERQVDRSAELQATQMVRAASVVAKDIADHVVRVRVIADLMATDRRDGTTFHQYQKALEVAQGNLSRARESYAQFFRDMQAMQPRIVLQAMDKVSEDLDRQGFKQQSQAAAIMKRQFGEYLSRRTVNMDQWAMELSSIIPAASAAKGTGSI